MGEGQNSNIDDTIQEPKTSGMKNAGKKAGKKAGRTIKRARKAAKKSGIGFIPSLLSLITTPIGWVLFGIIAILIIGFLVIGIIGFFATAPGIMMEKIANFFKDAIKEIYRDPRASTEIEVSEEAKVDLANYIQELGYDIVGYGFSDSENIEKDEDGNVIKVNKSSNNDYLYAYILSNERIYTLHGENDNLGGKVLDVLKTIFVPAYWWNKTVDAFLGGNVSDKAKEGMIEIDWDSAGQKADDVFDTVELNRDDKTLRIKRWNPGFPIIGRGLTNVDTWSWDLEGWSGRYGKPLELSLALHLSTMAPDFAYNFCMDEDLQTKVNISLRDIEYNATYEYKTANEYTVTKTQVDPVYEDLHNAIVELKFLSTSQNDKRELSTVNDGDDKGSFVLPVDIFTNTNVISIEDSYNKSKRYYKLTNEAGHPIRIFSSVNSGDILMNDYYMSISDDSGEPWFGVLSNEQDTRRLDLEFNGEKKFGWSWKSTNSVICIEQLCLNEIIDILSSDCWNDDVIATAHQSIEAIANLAGETIDTYIDMIKSPSQTYKRGDESYRDQFMDCRNTEDNDYRGTADKLRIIQSNLIEDFSIVEKDYKKQIADESEDLKKWGMNYDTLEILYNVFESVNTSIKTYQPYITSVKNHWYKDIYFVYTDEEGQKLKNISPEDIIYKDGDPENVKNQEYNPEGLASTEEIEHLNEDGQLYVNLTPKSGFRTIEQVGQPGYTDEEPWHWKVKNWLQYGYYFIYDGTEKTASEIKRAREYLKNDAINKYDSTDPLLGYNGESESVDVAAINQKAKDINEELKEKGYNVKLRKITFAKKSSLAAFSILESVHTLDAEYVYRDLKEFLIELGYFEREDFELIETGVLDWIIPEYKPLEWPANKYEKKDTEYGTFILSKASVEQIKGEKTEETEEMENSENNKNNINLEGFEEGLDVITPEEAIVENIDNNKSITLKFTTENKVKDMTIKIEGISVKEDIKKGSAVGKGDKIGTTTAEDIKLLMRDDKKAIINNIEDYIKLDKKDSNVGVIKNGERIDIPEGLGSVHSYMGWQMITSPSSEQYKLREAAGMNFDNEGFGIIDGRYVIACTTTYGRVGDYIDFYQEDGTVIECIIGDIKNQDDAGCNEWGHLNGTCIIEFVVDKDMWYDGHANPGTTSCHPEWNQNLTKAINGGNYFDTQH